LRSDAHIVSDMSKTSLPETLSVKEACSETGLHHTTIRRRIADGTLTAWRLGPRVIRIERASLRRLMSPIGGAV
jgi:excisionase family DNA binding protein